MGTQAEALAQAGALRPEEGGGPAAWAFADAPGGTVLSETSRVRSETPRDPTCVRHFQQPTLSGGARGGPGLRRGGAGGSDGGSVVPCSFSAHGTWRFC